MTQGHQFEFAASVAPQSTAASPESKLGEFIARAKQSPALKGIVWSEVQWEIAPDDPVAKSIRRHRSYRPTLTFTNRETSGRGRQRLPAEKRDAIPAGYADFAKADVRLYAESNNPGLSVLRRLVVAHQFLERALRHSGLEGSVCSLTLRHFELAEEDIAREQGGRTAYKVAKFLEHIGRTLDRRGLASAHIGYTARFKRPNDGDELTEAGETLGLEKMVSDEVLSVLADISSAPANEAELFIIRIVDLLVCGGFRIGEVLRLPADCWVCVEGGPGESTPNEGILYMAEKAQDYRTKWLPRQSVEIGRRAIKDLTHLTEHHRAVATWMEQHPGRLWPFRDLKSDDAVNGLDACARMGLSGPSHVNWRIFRERRGRETWFRVGDIEDLYLKRHNGAPVIVMPSGKEQTLAGTLILAWRNQLHGQRGTLEFLPQTITANQFADCVAPPDSRAGKAQGLLTSRGLKLTSHQLRHWLNTVLDNQGLSDVLQAQFFGRREITQNVAYKHQTLAERTELACKLILKGEAVGHVSRIAFSLPLAEREDFVKSVVETAHVTLYGFCIHNFAASPCPNCNQCLRKCPDYLRVKGDEEQRLALLHLREIEQAALCRNQMALADGFYGAEKWVDFSRELIEGIDEALAVDDDLAQPYGAQVQVFPASSVNPKLLK